MTRDTQARTQIDHNSSTFVHLADLHLAPRSASIAKRDPRTNRLVRDLDMDAALVRAVDDILEQVPLPSAVVVAGDVFDTWRGSLDAMLCVMSQVGRLRDAGIEVVGIAGNHDTPTRRSNTCMYQALMRAFSGDPGVTLAYDEVVHRVVGDVEYVLLPHQCCLDGSFDEGTLAPTGDAPRSVLVVHGVAAGDPTLQQADEAREVPVASWVMDMPWDYVAFGHYHRPGWIPGYEGKASYCGSLENTVISGPDVCMERGPVYVDLSVDGEGKRTMHPQPIRRIVELPDITIDASDGLSPDEVDALVDAAIRDGDTADAIVRLKVVGISRSTYQSLPRRSFAASDPSALLIRVEWEFASSQTTRREVVVDEETGEEVVVEVPDPDSSQGDGEAVVLPLDKEAELALEALVADGTVSEARREAVLEAFRGYVGA